MHIREMQCMYITNDRIHTTLASLASATIGPELLTVFQQVGLEYSHVIKIAYFSLAGKTLCMTIERFDQRFDQSHIKAVPVGEGTGISLSKSSFMPPLILYILPLTSCHHSPQSFLSLTDVS